MEKISLLQEFEKLGENPQGFESSSLIPVHAIGQKQFWDCGIACAAMVLSLYYRPSPSLESLETLASTQSVWTIDIAMLLRRCFHSPLFLFTSYIGLNPAYVDEKFYSKHMDKDRDRVNSLFKQAESNKISVVKRSVSAAELKFAVCSGRYLVIVLVDKGKLGGVEIESIGYIGHFILLHGYDNATNSYYIKDPAAAAATMTDSGGGGLQMVSVEQLEVSRLAHGTDEDLLFIELPSHIVARHSS